MLLLLHILIAISSLVYTGFVFFRPSIRRLRLSYILVGMTIASGTMLIITMPSHMVSACFTGLLYIAIVTSAIVSVHHKLVQASRL